MSTLAKSTKIKAAKKINSKRGRPPQSLNLETIEWLKENNISKEIYKKVLSKIRG